MCLSNDGPLEDKALTIFKWGDRALYLMLFVSFMAARRYWHLPFTLPFLGAVVCFTFVVLFRKKEETEESDLLALGT